MRQGARTLSIVLGVLLVGVLVRYWILVAGLFRRLADDGLNLLWSAPALTYVVVVGGFLVLLVAAFDVGCGAGRYTLCLVVCRRRRSCSPRGAPPLYSYPAFSVTRAGSRFPNSAPSRR